MTRSEGHARAKLNLLELAQYLNSVSEACRVTWVSIQMSDPVRDFEYARNAVTLTYDLSGVERVRLTFQALEFGDEPHGPRKDEGGSEKVENDGVFGPVADFNFDGVAVSADGVDWYEIQGLRGLRSDRFTAYDLDLDAAVAALRLAYNGAFRVRFCQYDDNPAPMDGVSIKGIELRGDLRPPILHLTMDDNAANPTVLDASEGHHDQTFVDPGGNPNTSAHSVAGVDGRALAFDGVDDRIVLDDASHRHVLAANRDFSIAMWWKTNSPPPLATLHFLSNYAATESSLFWYTNAGNVTVAMRFVTSEVRWVAKAWTGGADDIPHHYAVTRRGTNFSIYRDGVLAVTDNHVENAQGLAPVGKNLAIASAPSGGAASPGQVDDFRVYDRALLASEIQVLAAAS